MVNIIKGKKEELEIKVSDIIADIVRNKQDAKLILATGNSPVGVYNGLINHYKNGVSFGSVTSYNLDEYLEVEKYQEDSFKKFMNDKLFNHIDINKANTYFPSSPEEYNEKLDKIEKFDFTILGVGTNGHIAFNEPGTSFTSRTHEVELTQSTIESNFPGRDDYPTQAITMGLNDIYNKSSKIILLAWGEGKRDALNKLLKGEKSDDCPITHFVDHPDFTIITDLIDL